MRPALVAQIPRRHFRRRDAPLRDLARGRVTTPVFKERVATAAASLGSSSLTNSHLVRSVLSSTMKVSKINRGPGLRHTHTHFRNSIFQSTSI